MVAAQQFNLIGSHDTPRALSLLDGNRDLYRLMVALLFTYPGVPSVYYGDEIGLGGVHGSNPRQCMSWDPSTWDMQLQAYFKFLIHLRRTSPALMDGGFQVLWTEDDTLVFQRDSEAEVIIVAARCDSQTRPVGPIPVSPGAIPDGTEFVELFSHQCAVVQDGLFPLPVLSPGAQVWIAKIL